MPVTELLVRVVDKNPNDPGASMRGDVIAVVPGGMPWGREELANPVWRILRADVPQSFLQTILSHPEEFSLRKPVRKHWRVDLASLPNTAQFSGQRMKDIIDVPSDRLIAATSKKPL